MATDHPLLTRVRVGAVKTETTTGTAISLAGADGALNFFDPKIAATIPPTERQAQGSLTSLAPIPGARMGKFTAKTELYNAASAPLWLSTMLLACGCQVSSGGVYSPLTGAVNTITAGLYQDGTTLKSIAGAQGNLKMSGVYGKPVELDWEFSGVWQPPSSTAIIAPTYPSALPPRFAGATITVGAVAYRISKFDFDFGNTVVMREDVSNVAGYHSAFITGRKPVIKIDPESVPLTTEDWYAAHLAGTTMAFSCAVGSGSNGIITIAAANLQLLNAPQDGDRNGLRTDDLEFLCTSTTADGEFTITPS